MTTSPTIKDIETKLSKCYTNSKHVLLHGKDTLGRTRLVREVHSESNGKYMDCKNMDFQMIYTLLTDLDIWVENGEYNLGSLKVETIKENLLHDFKGVLFIDNLECGLENFEAIEYCDKLANAIKKSSLRWLVVYTPSYTDFPEALKKQFVHIPLDGKDYEVKGQKEKIVIETTKVIVASREDHEEEVIVGSNKDMTKTKDTEPALYKKTPKNAKWQDLTMGFPNHLEDKVDIYFKGEEKDTVPLKDLGFVDKKATKTFKLYKCINLLKQFAKDNKEFHINLAVKKRVTLHSQVKSLNHYMKRCFGIDGDPVQGKERGGYNFLFKAYCYDMKIKQDVDMYHDSLNANFIELKKEVSSSAEYRDPDSIKMITQSIVGVTKEIVQRVHTFRLNDVICLKCYKKIPTYIISKDNIEILCDDCLPEATNEYQSKNVVDFKDNDIPRSE